MIDTPLDAATLMVLRDGAEGLEVFMTRRAATMAFAPNAMVFPGGKVDDEDHLDSATHPLRAFQNAVLREAFEEVGLLLARIDDQVLSSARWQSLMTHRAPIARREVLFQQFLFAQGLVPDYDTLTYVSRWITPPKFPKRFDTRFFIAEMPSEQILQHDGSEAVASEWMRPQDLLDRSANGQETIFPPTYWMLSDLTAFDTVAAAKAEMQIAHFEPDLRNKQA